MALCREKFVELWLGLALLFPQENVHFTLSSWIFVQCVDYLGQIASHVVKNTKTEVEAQVLKAVRMGLDLGPSSL